MEVARDIDALWTWHAVPAACTANLLTASYYPADFFDQLLFFEFADARLGCDAAVFLYHFCRVPDKKVTYWQGSYGDITAMNAENMTVGFFEGGYTVLSNKDYEKPMPVTFTVTEGKQVRKYDKQSGLWTDMTPADGQYKITLAPGDGEMIWVN